MGANTAPDHSLLYQWSRDLQLWLFIVATLQLFRLTLVLTFREQFSADTGPGDLLQVMALGLRFDLSTATMWVLPTVLAALLLGPLLPGLRTRLDRLRLRLGQAYVSVTLLLFAADLVYFDEYGDQFDQRVFGMINDDTVAILITIWKEYHPLLFLLALIPAIAAGLFLLRRWLRTHPRALATLHRGPRGVPARTATAVLVFLFFAAAARGGTLWGEPIRLKHAFVVKDLALNRMVVNHLTALRHTLETQWRLQESGGLAAIWPEGDLSAALALARPEAAAGKEIDAAFMRRADGSDAPPRHVFLVLGESFSGWPAFPRYRDVGITPQMARLADRGLYFRNFLPSGDGTIRSLATLVTGLPDAGLPVNYEPRTSTAYPTALAAIFRDLGFRTRFFYGGFLGWQRLDSFALAQGFDEVHGGGQMSAGTTTNEWGVGDDALFDYVLETVAPDRPSFNLILTTSNHPPYDIDLAREGFPVQSLPAPLQATKAETLKVLGHLWFSDRELGRFVDAAEGRFAQSLFALTGDHTSRLQIRFPGDNVFEQYAVPLVLYGPEVLNGRPGRPQTAGSHLDLVPTLVERAAPAGFEYHAFGRDLLDKPSPSVALGYDFFLGEDFIASYEDPPTAYGLEPGAEPPVPAEELQRLRRRFDALRALSWYRIRNGSHLPTLTADAR